MAMRQIYEQQVIPAISTMKEFEKYLDSSETYAILMDFHLSMLQNLIELAHKKEKRVILHLDLVKGLSSDESGCEYACQVLGADGIISTKAKVVETAKKNKKISILRFFLIDSKSLDKGVMLCNSIEPDYVEVLPGIAYSILPSIKKRTDTKIMCGGLIKTKEEMEACLSHGAVAITISGLYKNKG